MAHFLLGFESIAFDAGLGAIGSGGISMAKGRTESKTDQRAGEERRKFLKRAGKAAATAPAVALLLSVNAQRAKADIAPTVSGLTDFANGPP